MRAGLLFSLCRRDAHGFTQLVGAAEHLILHAEQQRQRLLGLGHGQDAVQLNGGQVRHFGTRYQPGVSVVLHAVERLGVDRAVGNHRLDGEQLSAQQRLGALVGVDQHDVHENLPIASLEHEPALAGADAGGGFDPGQGETAVARHAIGLGGGQRVDRRWARRRLRIRLGCGR
ncbi:MAG: hypothetical protein ACOYJA_04685 [Christensenellales bacterium]